MQSPSFDISSLNLDAKKYLVKITISMANEPNIVEEVVYYRRYMDLDFFLRWAWYFEYLAARVKVANPRRVVELIGGSDEWLSEEEERRKKSASLLKTKLNQIRKLKKEVINDDLFGLTSAKHDAKIQRVQNDIDALQEGTFDVFYMPEYKNTIKDWI